MTAHSHTCTVAEQRGDGIVVVGAGLAGLFTALKLAPLPVTVISPARVSAKVPPACGRRPASPRRSPKATRPRTHAADTVVAGAGIVDEASRACCMAREARGPHRGSAALRRPLRQGSRRPSQPWATKRRTARNRILHVKGDTAGRAIMAALSPRPCGRTPSITVLEGYVPPAI